MPSFVERSANVSKAVSDTLRGKTFDNGVLCSSEQALVYEAPLRDQIYAELHNWKVYILNDQEMEKLARVMVTPSFGINPRIVGKPPQFIAQQAGFSIPPDAPAMIAPLKGVGRDYPLSMEKLSPVLALYEVPDYNAGVDVCIQLLRFGGLGHTMSFHSTNQERIVETGLRVPVFRLVINSPATHGSVGLTTGLDPAMTLGCGAVGGNITSDNITPVHLINIKRVAFEVRDAASASPAPVAYPGRTRTAGAAPQAAQSLEDRIAKFLDNRLGGVTPKAPQASPPAPPPQNPHSHSATVQLGEHKIYPIHPPEPPKTSIIPTPAIYPVSTGNPHNKEKAEMIGPLDFVCEDDVRQAITAGKIIGIHSRTIITPSANDLAFNRNIFKKIEG